MREISSQRPAEQRVLAFAIAIFVCVFLGPFGTAADLDLQQRLAFWTVAIVAVGTVMEACFVAALNSRWLKRTHISVPLLIGAAIGAVPGTAFIIFVNLVFRPEHIESAHFFSLWIKVAIMGLLVAGLDGLIWYRLSIASAKNTALDTVPSPAPSEAVGRAADDQETLGTFEQSRLAKRLPDKLRNAQIISMSMQDHYVEITTTQGSEMLLMRLSDAIDLTDGLEGEQTHRSHWAAAAHAVSLSKIARRFELTLSDGRSLPVSQSFRNEVEKMLNAKGQA